MVLGCNKNVTPVKENDRERVFDYRQQAVVWGKGVFLGGSRQEIWVREDFLLGEASC